jgi:hypothetical protein
MDMHVSIILYVSANKSENLISQVNVSNTLDFDSTLEVSTILSLCIHCHTLFGVYRLRPKCCAIIYYKMAA